MKTYKGFFLAEKYKNLYLSKNTDIAYCDPAEKTVKEVLENLNTSNKFERFDYLENSIESWATKYHFSWDRQNILKPIHFNKHDVVLELGGGTGILTEYIAEKVSKIISIEGTKARASSIAERCKCFNNIDVIVANFLEIDLLDIFGEHTFDKITLIGVLEYVNEFSKNTDEDAINEILTICNKLLKPDGELIIAIENRIGLKYLLGFEEDHTGIPHYGTQNLYKKKGVITFTKKQLIDRLIDTGFEETDFWYPFPDYKLPSCIFKEGNYMKDKKAKLLMSSLLSKYISQNYSMRESPMLSEGRIINNFIEDESLGVVSNSFLIVAKKKNKQVKQTSNGDVIGYYFSIENRYKYATEIQFSNQGYELKAIEKYYKTGEEKCLNIPQLLIKHILQEFSLFTNNNISLQSCNEILAKNDLPTLTEEEYYSVNKFCDFEAKEIRRREYKVKTTPITEKNLCMLFWRKIKKILNGSCFL